MAKELTFYEQQTIEFTLKLRSILQELPDFSKDYFRSIEFRTSAKTRVVYAYDLRIFLAFLLKQNPAFSHYTIKDFTLSDLQKLTTADIEEYKEYLKLYNLDDREYTNGERGIARKISSIKSFFSYLYRFNRIDVNPTALVESPKIHDKVIIRLDEDEIVTLLDSMEQLEHTLTGQEKLFFEKTKYRDIAIITLLLGTGIRVSECIGLNLTDVDFRNGGIKVTRKGGNEMIVYFGTEVEEALTTYLECSRAAITPLSGHEQALFLSIQKKRISDDAVQKLVKKYARRTVSNKDITPHKLRSSYGTKLYRDTGDIYLVADVLGHEDVNTTKKHYAAQADENRRKAAKNLKLRESRDKN